MKKITIELFNCGIDITNNITNECYSMDWETFWKTLQREKSRKFRSKFYDNLFGLSNSFEIIKSYNFENCKFYMDLFSH